MIHRGTVAARALFFDVELLGEDKARRRVLENWLSGAQVYYVENGYLLRWDAPQFIRCETAPGLPLSEERGLLLSAPLSDDEKRELDISSESLILIRDGAAQVFSLSALQPIDISSWLDISDFQTAPLYSLGEVPAPPPILVQETTFDVREKLGVQAAPELEKLLAQMDESKSSTKLQTPLWTRLLVEMGAWWQSLVHPSSKRTSSRSLTTAGAALIARPSLWKSILVMVLMACAALALTSGIKTQIDFAALVFVIVIGLMLYGFLWIAALFLAPLFSGFAWPRSNISWLKWLPLGLLGCGLFWYFAIGHSLENLVNLVGTIALWLLIGMFVLGMLAALIWLLSSLVRNAKSVAKPKAAAPVSGDVPWPWTIGGAGLGVFIGAMQRGDILVAIVSALVILVALIWSLFRLRKQRLAKARGALPATPKVTPPKAPSLMPPAPVEGPLAALRNALARAIWMAGLWRIYGPIQARYIARLMDMFARGDLENALRHAIPMGTSATGSARPAFGVPRARSLLKIFTGQRVGASVMPMPPDIAEQLRQQYRAAFERLEAQGKHEEAAFVLAELLHASEEAVGYLERHNRLRLAAELAESRDLPADLVVRQWLVAGETERAIWIARRKNAFYNAIVRLEKGGDDDKKSAQKLRLLWANELARGGDYVAAVGAVWPVIEARNLANEWIKRGLLLGGSAKARMLSWQCQTATSLDPELRDTVAELLNQVHGAEARLLFAKGINEGTPTPVTKTVARATARALVRDGGSENFNEVRKAACQKLIEISGDGALRADVPQRLFVSTGKSLKECDEPIEIVIEAADTGALPLHDAAYLPDGRSVVALGEAGARLLSREGKTIAHFDQPCHRLVVSDQGDRALALAWRGDATRIAKLDFSTRRAVSWCETRISNCAFSYDGSLWFVAAQGSILAIDATSPKFGALWHTAEVGDIAHIERTPHVCTFITRFIARGNFGFGWREKWERWLLETPSLILRQRNVIEAWEAKEEDLADAQRYLKGVTTDGAWARLERNEKDNTIKLTPQNVNISLSRPQQVPHLLGSNSTWWLIGLIDNRDIEILLLDRAKTQVRARVQMEGSRTAQTRFSENHLTLCDDRGRFLVLDLQSGALLKNFRLT